MSEYSKAMVESGYLSKAGKEKQAEIIKTQGPKGWNTFVSKLSNSAAEKFANEEEDEEYNVDPGDKHAQYVRTGYPPPNYKLHLMTESFSMSLEESYYWIVSQFRRGFAFDRFIKITDIFSASEQSSFWGAAQTRIKIQQDNVTQYMATIGKMIKDLFQIVRELRLIDERLYLYDTWDQRKSSDLTLKGMFIDLVEGASKNPSSVYGLAQQVGFTILPDLFFSTRVFDSSKVDEVVDALEYNVAIKNVLKRKLLNYVVWKEKTDKEIRARRKFQLQYLRQHWAVIKMYMDWIKPYLKNIQRMQMDSRRSDSVDIVSAFETSITEIEFIAMKPAVKGIHPVVLTSFEFRTRPDLSFQQDNYAHRGPVHVGRMVMKLRTYGWTESDIKKYQDYRRKESMQLFGIVDESVKAAMDALGNELEDYLRESGEGVPLKEEENIPKTRKINSWGIFDPFVSVIKGFGEIFFALIPINNVSFKRAPKSSEPDQEAKDGVAKSIQGIAWLVFKNYKKAHRMITW
jgi:hypothetical protein